MQSELSPMQIDINCDLGEGFPEDARLMPFISSANIACGAHAGNDDLMRATAELAMQHQVQIGAHPGYQDRNNFGRTEQSLSAAALYDLITMQVHRMKQITDDLGGILHHVKPHGALYNLSARSMETAATIARAVYDVDPTLYLYGLSGSCSIMAAKALGLPTRQEVFADRRYDDNGQLLSRKHAEALITNHDIACQHVLQMIGQQTISSLSAKIIPVVAETVCIHGDTAGASALAAHLFYFLNEHDIQLLRK
jgi:UPF0271 protein